MSHVRIGVAGLGVMGSSHAKQISEGLVPGGVLAAVADPFADLGRFGDNVKAFRSSEEMICSGEIDAVIIATPHYSHTDLGIAALEAGLHVLVEKPISVHKADAERLVAAHKNPKQLFSAMFCMRLTPAYAKVRELIQKGELGEIIRINWIITTWFRSQAYYNSGGWRATGEGEGGGVLINQCPHKLDLMQWLFGMPEKVRAFCRLGQHHQIEVEDEVTAYLEYANGASGVFVASTGEAPGTNRLEITADRGKLVLENGRIFWNRTEVSVREFCATTSVKMGSPATWDVEVPVLGEAQGNLGIIRNFTAAILDEKVKLIAPASDGIHSVELGNAMLQSSFLDQTVSLPLDGKVFEGLLQQKIAESAAKKAGK